MHLCYVDDSGDPSRGKLLTALLIRDTDWADVLDAWLTGREAADLIAYGAYHKHRQTYPELWGGSFQPSHAAIAAYMQTSAHWPAESDDGVHWLSSTQEPPA